MESVCTKMLIIFTILLSISHQVSANQETVCTSSNPPELTSQEVQSEKASSEIVHAKLEFVTNPELADRCGMTDSEVKAIIAYTGNKFYESIAKSLDPRTSEYDALRPLTDTIIRALRHLADFKRTVLHAGNERPNPPKAGDVIKLTGFLSATAKSEQVFPGAWHYLIHSIHGKHIAGFSQFPNAEDEVLFAPNTSFRILAVDAKKQMFVGPGGTVGFTEILDIEMDELEGQ